MALSDAQPEAGPCEVRCVAVRGDVLKAKKSGSRWGGVAGQQAASGPAPAR